MHYRHRVLALLMVAASFACGDARDFILMIDTSGSMAGSRDTLKKVQTGMPAFLDRLEKGDRVTLMTFDDEARTGEIITYNGEEDRQRIIDAVNNLKADGRYTHMSSMVEALRARADDIRSEGRPLYIVVMSDGRDDPPPDAEDETLDIAAYRDPELSQPEDPYYIYYVNLGRLADPELQEQLEEMGSDEVQTIDAGEGDDAGDEPLDLNGDGIISDEELAAQAAEETGLTEVGEDVDRQTSLGWLRKYGIWIAIAIGILILLVLLFLLFRWFVNRHKAQGKLRYYESSVGPRMAQETALGRLNKSKVHIGPRFGADVRVRDIGIPENVRLKVKKQKGNTVMRPDKQDLPFFKFESQASDGLVSPGDRFTIGNYNFEYQDGESKSD